MNKSDFKDDHDYADFATPTYDCYEYDEVPSSKMPDIDDFKDEDDVDVHIYDHYVGAHVRVPIGDDIRSRKVVRYKRELDGTLRGDPMPTQCWMQELMKLSSLMAAM
jgi:hypothetical protein